MTALYQALLALATELASLSLLDRSTSDLRLAAYFFLHAVAAALTTALAWVLMPKLAKQGRLPGMALIFCLGFFVPGLGVVAILVILHAALRFPKGFSVERYAEVDAPRYVTNEKDKAAMSDLRAGHARRVLADPQESVDNKLRVLIALQDMRPKVAIPMLQGLLGDASEDIRLLAYSMMDAWEKDIARRVQAAQAQLLSLGDQNDPETKSQRFNGHRQLAELYWEQVDSKLARGDLRRFALQQAKEQCELALAQNPNAAGVWLLFAEVLVELGLHDVAERASDAADRAGADPVQVSRIVARLAFDRRQFLRVQAHMKRIHQSKRAPLGLKQLARYWSGKAVDVPL